MIFILPAFFVVGALLMGVWWLFFRAAVRHEQAVAAARRREEGFEKMLSTPGEPLYCLGCGQAFHGPLDEFGCPHCHTRAFVLPARLSGEKAVKTAVDAMTPYTLGAADAPEVRAESVGGVASTRDTSPSRLGTEHTEQKIRRNGR